MPSPAVTRELGVTYAGVTLGGTSDTLLLFDRHEVRGGYETIGFTGRVLARGGTEAEFAAACASLETAFSTPNGALAITQGSATMKSFGHSASTGFLGRPSYRKVGGKEDTGRSRLYEVRVDAQRPADLSGKSGLRIASIAVTTKFFSARSYRVTGTYTAISSTSARAKYAASVGTFLSAIETDLAGSPGTWLRMDASVEYDDENKVAHFTQDAFENGLRDGTYTLATTQQALRSYHVTGAYTAVGGTGATATYTGAIGALLSAFESALGGTWLRGASSYTVDQGDKLLKFDYVAIETGLRDAVYNVVETPSGVREYTLTGQYEKVSSTGALATFNSALGAVLSTLESALTGTWERMPALYRQDQTDTTITFTATARELIYNQSQGVLDNTSMNNVRIRIEPSSEAPGDSQDVARPIRVLVMFEADVVKSATQDLKALYGETVRTYLVDRAKASVGASAAALVAERPGYDFTANRLSAVVAVEAFTSGFVLQIDIETEDDDDKGIALVPVYDGDPLEHEEYQLSRRLMRTITTRAVLLGADVELPPPGVPSSDYVLMRTNDRKKTLILGLSGVQQAVTILTRTDVYQMRKAPSGGGGQSVATEVRLSTGKAFS